MYQEQYITEIISLKPPIKSIKPYKIIKDCSHKLAVLAKNNEKAEDLLQLSEGSRNQIKFEDHFIRRTFYS